MTGLFPLASRNQIHKDHDHCDHEKDVDESSHRRAAEESEKPEDDQQAAQADRSSKYILYRLVHSKASDKAHDNHVISCEVFGHHRVQRKLGVLHDHGHPSAAELAHARVGQGQDVLAVHGQIPSGVPGRDDPRSAPDGGLQGAAAGHGAGQIRAACYCGSNFSFTTPN